MESNSSIDQSQFLKQVKERAQVVSKSARQNPGDVAEKFEQDEGEGDMEIQDYLAVIRGTDPDKQEIEVKITIGDDLELDFASGLASNRKLDFSKERSKANLAQRRVQKRRRPQSWAWVATSGSAVQIEEKKGVSGNEINLSVKLEEDDVEPEPESKEAEETPKAAQPQGRFSAPAFSNNLMADLGNFLKKSKKPESTDNNVIDRPTSPEKNKDESPAKQVVSPPLLKKTKPSSVISPRPSSTSPDPKARFGTSSTSTRSVNPVVERTKVVVVSNDSPRLQSPVSFVTDANADAESKAIDSKNDGKDPGDLKMDVDDDSKSDRNDDVTRVQDTTGEEFEKKSSVGDGKNVEGSKSPVITNSSKFQLPPLIVKPKLKNQSSSAMLAKAAAESSQNQVAKEAEKKAVANKPRWLQELKLKKQKEEIPKTRRNPLVVKGVEVEEAPKSIPSWIQSEASKREKLKSPNDSASNRDAVSTSVGGTTSKPAVIKSEEKQEPSWLKELNKRKQNRNSKIPKNEEVNSGAKKEAGVSLFDYRSKAKQDEARKDENDDDEGKGFSIMNIKKRFDKKVKPGFSVGETVKSSDASKVVKIDKLTVDVDKADEKEIAKAADTRTEPVGIDAKSFENDAVVNLKIITKIDDSDAKIRESKPGNIVVDHRDYVEAETAVSNEGLPRVEDEIVFKIDNDISGNDKDMKDSSKKVSVDDKELISASKQKDSTHIDKDCFDVFLKKSDGVKDDSDMDFEPSLTVEKVAMSQPSIGLEKNSSSEAISRKDTPEKMQVDDCIDKKDESRDGNNTKLESNPEILPQSKVEAKDSNEMVSSITKDTQLKEHNSFDKSDSFGDKSVMDLEPKSTAEVSQLNENEKKESKMELSARKDALFKGKMSFDNSFDEHDNARGKNQVNSEPVKDEVSTKSNEQVTKDDSPPEKVLVTERDLGQQGSSRQKISQPNSISNSSSKDTSDGAAVAGDIGEVSCDTAGKILEKNQQSKLASDPKASKVFDKKTDVGSVRQHPTASKKPPVLKAKPKILKKDGERVIISREGSPVFQAKSPISREDSPVFRAKSPVSREDSPVFRAKSPVSREDSPVFRAKSPVSREDSPVLRAISPVSQEDSPLISDAETNSRSEPDAKKEAFTTEFVYKDVRTESREDVPKPMRTKLVRVNSFEQGALSKPKFETRDRKDENIKTKAPAHADVSMDEAAKNAEITKTISLEDKNAKKTTDKTTDEKNENKDCISVDAISKQVDLGNKNDAKQTDDQVVGKTERLHLESKEPSMIKDEPSRSETIKEPSTATIQNRKIEVSKPKPAPPRIKPKPKIKPKELIKQDGIATKQLNEKNEKNNENKIAGDVKEAKENVVDAEGKQTGKNIDNVTMRPGPNNRNKTRRPVSMIEDMRPLSQNKQYGRDRVSSTSSNKRFSTELEKKQNACWFRGVLPANVEKINEYDDIPAWKKQLLARLKPAENSAKKPSPQNASSPVDNGQEMKLKSKVESSSSAPNGSQKKAITSAPESADKEADKSPELEESPKPAVPAFMREFSKKRNLRPRSVMAEKPKDDWV